MDFEREWLIAMASVFWLGGGKRKERSWPCDLRD